MILDVGSTARDGSRQASRLTTGRVIIGVWLFGLLAAAPAFAADLASRTLLLDAAIAGNAVVAVGERGTILRSTDDGKTWVAATRPVSAMLTAVSFADASRGWAVGHDGVILATTDGGQTWQRQWQSENLSDSFLDVMALAPLHVVAIGAYGLFMETADGGHTWSRRKLIQDDYHLNRISRAPNGTLYIAGEHGTLLRGDEAAAGWTAIPAPYDGSFYGVLCVNDDVLLAHGLRGRLYRSTDGGSAWALIETNAPVLLAAATKLRNGTIVLAGQARALLISTDGGITVNPRDVGVRTGIAELLELADGSVLVLGESGATRIPLEKATTPAGK